MGNSYTVPEVASVVYPAYEAAAPSLKGKTVLGGVVFSTAVLEPHRDGVTRSWTSHIPLASPVP